jgi:hypothetical protein
MVQIHAQPRCECSPLLVSLPRRHLFELLLLVLCNLIIIRGGCTTCRAAATAVALRRTRAVLLLLLLVLGCSAVATVLFQLCCILCLLLLLQDNNDNNNSGRLLAKKPGQKQDSVNLQEAFEVTSPWPQIQAKQHISTLKSANTTLTLQNRTVLGEQPNCYAGRC